MSTPRMSLEQELREIIVDYSPVDPETLTENTDLLDQQIVDSLGVQALMAFAEERIGRPLAESELVRANFSTIARITAFVRGQMLTAA
jgi:acyl carrier protein